MNLRLKNRMIVVILIIFLTAGGLDSLYAAWWEIKSIPVPHDTQEVKKEKRVIAGQTFDFTYYVSQLGISSVIDFYEKRLSVLGWQKKDLIADLSKTRDFKADPGFNAMMGKNPMFEKGDEVIIISFLPEGSVKDKMTRYTFAQGVAASGKEDSERAEDIVLPELLAKPKNNPAPVYPGAVLSDLYEQPNMMRATYFVKEDIGKVVDFYKDKMSQDTWSLVQEKPLATVTMQPEVKDIYELCPNCPEGTPQINPTIRSQTAALVYEDGRGGTYRIVFSELTAQEERQHVLRNITTILVNYEKKTK